MMTKEVTTGGNNFFNGLIKYPRTISKIPPIKQAPINAPYPYKAPIAFAVPIKPELVPITIGNLAPTFHTGYNCTSVTTAATNIAF